LVAYSFSMKSMNTGPPRSIFSSIKPTCSWLPVQIQIKTALQSSQEYHLGTEVPCHAMMAGLSLLQRADRESNKIGRLEPAAGIIQSNWVDAQNVEQIQNRSATWKMRRRNKGGIKMGSVQVPEWRPLLEVAALAG
jgi:hypothetical protein